MIYLIVSIAVIWAATMVAVWVGYRMGRTVSGYPAAPIIKPKQKNLVEEDPYYKPMYGEEPTSAPTVDER